MKTGRIVGSIAAAGTVLAAASAQAQIMTQAGVFDPVGLNPSAAYGCSVALTPNAAVLGSTSDNRIAVYPRRLGGGFGAPVMVTDPFGRDKGLGCSVAMEGSTLVAGAPLFSGCTPGDGPMSAGVLMVYTVNARGAVSFTQQIEHGGVDRMDKFGNAVAISGDTIIAGAKSDNTLGHASGTAYVFRNIDGVWEREAQLCATDGRMGDLAGWSVDISGDVAVVGAPFDQSGLLFAGSVQVFERLGDQWTHTQTLESPVPTASGYFGVSVATDGDRIIVGETGTNRAYVFDRTANGWASHQRLSRSGAGAMFGAVVEIRGNEALVSAPGLNRVDRFSLDRSRWSLVQSMTSPSSVGGSQFGSAIAAFASEVLVGARFAGDGLAVLMHDAGASSDGTAGAGSAVTGAPRMNGSEISTPSRAR
jgi:hypothetical protein